MAHMHFSNTKTSHSTRFSAVISLELDAPETAEVAQRSCPHVQHLASCVCLANMSLCQTACLRDSQRIRDRWMLRATYDTLKTFLNPW